MGIRDRLHAIKQRVTSRSATPQVSNRELVEAVIVMGNALVELDQKINAINSDATAHIQDSESRMSKLERMDADVKASLNYLRIIAGKRQEERKARAHDEHEKRKKKAAAGPTRRGR